MMDSPKLRPPTEPVKAVRCEAAHDSVVDPSGAVLYPKTMTPLLDH